MKRPITEKQLAANRANAAKSTGPRTPTGKVRSSLNARKHGLLAQTVSVLRLEDQGELDNLRADAVACYQPRDAQEMFAVERIAVAQLMMIRGWRLEAGMFIKCLNMFLNDDESSMFRIHADLFPDREVQVEQNRNFAMSEGFDRIAKGSNIWSLILRYQAQTERQYRRAIEELDRLRRREDDFPNEPISDPDPEHTKEETSSTNEPNAPDAASATSAPSASEPGQPVAAPNSPKAHSQKPQRLCVSAVQTNPIAHPDHAPRAFFEPAITEATDPDAASATFAPSATEPDQPVTAPNSPEPHSQKTQRLCFSAVQIEAPRNPNPPDPI